MFLRHVSFKVNFHVLDYCQWLRMPDDLPILACLINRLNYGDKLPATSGHIKFKQQTFTLKDSCLQLKWPANSIYHFCIFSVGWHISFWHDIRRSCCYLCVSGRHWQFDRLWGCQVVNRWPSFEFRFHQLWNVIHFISCDTLLYYFEIRYWETVLSVSGPVNLKRRVHYKIDMLNIWPIKHFKKLFLQTLSNFCEI